MISQTLNPSHDPVLAALLARRDDLDAMIEQRKKQLADGDKRLLRALQDTKDAA